MRMIEQQLSLQEGNATRWALPTILNNIFHNLPAIFQVLLYFSPLILARKSSINGKSLKAWAWKMFRLNCLVVAMLALISFSIAIDNWFDSSYAAGKRTIIQQVTECAVRFKELACEIDRKTSAERECFALGMCLAQPLWALTSQAFLGNWWEIYKILVDNYRWIPVVISLTQMWLSRLLSKTSWPMDLLYIVDGIVDGDERGSQALPAEIDPMTGVAE
ncbi:hypothetical protein WAI453_010464 [Rhynchosporium graminicola]